MNRAEPTSPARAAVTQALQTHSRELRGFVHARVPAADVDDVLQVAAMRAVERSGSLQDPERVLAWLYRIHRNIIIDTARKRASQARWQEPSASADEAVSLVEQDHCDCSVAQAQRLKPSYAALLNLVDIQGASLSEAATSLGITVNNATVRLHRARKALRKAMFDHCGVQSALECGACRCIDDGCCAS